MPHCIPSCVIFFVCLWGFAFGGPFVSLVEVCNHKIFLASPNLSYNLSQGHENNVKNGPAEQFSKIDNTTEFQYSNKTATLTAIIQAWPPQSGINR